MTMRRIHHLSAALLRDFIALHLANHLIGLGGQDLHRSVARTLGRVYRHSLVEPLLLGLVGLQGATGLRMALAWMRRIGRLSQLLRWQRLSGLYLALFLTLHLGAVLSARWQSIETDLAFAATAFQAGGAWPWVFAAYYAAAVLSVGLHLGAFARRHSPRVAPLCLLAGGMVSITIVRLLSGAITPISIPPAQIAAFPFLP